jgi:hypothetical protein
VKITKGITSLIVVLSMMALAACGGSGGGEGTAGSGTMTVSITDAKPKLPAEATNLWVTFEEFLVHKPGSGWISLPLVEDSYTIDLLQFQDGNTTDLVPPTKLEAGKYTQVRIVVSSAEIRIVDEGPPETTEDSTVDVPSGNLKTDKNFLFDVDEDAAVDLVVHFDLSKSLVVTGPAVNPSYKLKPVLHLFEDPREAATIAGRIADSAFGEASEKATITVLADSNDEKYTIVEVPKSDNGGPAEFSIFWLVPDASYTVEIDLDQDDEIDCREDISGDDLPAGAIFELNGGDPINIGSSICQL